MFDFDQLQGLPFTRQIELLSDYIIELEALFGLGPSVESAFGGLLSPSEEAIALAFLSNKGRVTLAMLEHLLYGGRRADRVPSNPSMSIRQFVCRMRIKLRPYNVGVPYDFRARHWRMTETSLANLRLLKISNTIEGQANASRSRVQPLHP